MASPFFFLRINRINTMCLTGCIRPKTCEPISSLRNCWRSESSKSQLSVYPAAENALRNESKSLKMTIAKQCMKYNIWKNFRHIAEMYLVKIWLKHMQKPNDLRRSKFCWWYSVYCRVNRSFFRVNNCCSYVTDCSDQAVPTTTVGSSPSVSWSQICFWISTIRLFFTFTIQLRRHGKEV